MPDEEKKVDGLIDVGEADQQATEINLDDKEDDYNELKDSNFVTNSESCSINNFENSDHDDVEDEANDDLNI